ncbi:nickel pincer cofactor biosynthesis protein LarB [Nocardia vinacea]|uniref:Nickel pincer cofactor biosynthesis protein LarB n=1 Tax=Nocardia vinacea TaxID=96468 RepID=A0ABZ1YT72_9NOCA|nr:nickel pincer cofactor biosynthesis protein LarB [Nocardia vinacea]
MNDITTNLTTDVVQLDLARPDRIGFGEAVLCEPKTVEQIVRALDQARDAGQAMLLTRLQPQQFAALPAEHRTGLEYDPLSRTAFRGQPAPRRACAPIAVVTGGTSDIPVAREAIRSLAFHGYPTSEIYDVGVAGLWRLQRRLDDLARHPVIIAVAGMDAALPTVLAGLVPALVIAVPTSVGYGVAEGGRTALNSLLTSCAPGLVVTNIDNGYGAACAAMRSMR